MTDPAAAARASGPPPIPDDACGGDVPVNLAAAERLRVRDLLVAYALLRGEKVALPHLMLLREAFPALFRIRPRERPVVHDACDEACLSAIRTLLERRGHLQLVAGFDDAPGA